MVDSILPKGFVLEKTNNTTLPEGFVLEKENIVESNIIEKEPNDLFTGIKNFFAMPFYFEKYFTGNKYINQAFQNVFW